MKEKILAVKTVIALIAMFSGQMASANNSIDLQSQIQQACFRAGQIKSPKNKRVKEICTCVAKSHSDAAAQEPSKKGAADLRWILQLYSFANMKDVLAHAKTNVFLFDYDSEVAETCQQHADSN